jgi:hypothetical protein
MPEEADEQAKQLLLRSCGKQRSKKTEKKRM